MTSSILRKIATYTGRLKAIFKVPEQTLRPKFRVLRIEKTEESEFAVVVQVINKNHVFKMKPEEILADDSFTDSFYPRDVRTLTYLGYLGINSPKYTILAQRFKENNQLIFALKEKDSKKILIKTPAEISANKELLNGLNQTDAHMVGFSAGTEHVAIENTLMNKALLTSQTKLDDMENSQL